MLQPYPYSPLDKATGEIRLITLLPGSFSSAIQIEIQTVSLTNDTSSSFPYEALSYVWGSAEDRVSITVVEGSTNYFLQVTQNLAGALPYLRDEHHSRSLWVDAICINQEDIAERGRQVMRMEDIYAWANRVVVWLGPPKEGNDIAMAALNDLGRRVIVDWHTNIITWQEPILDSSPFMDTSHSIDLSKQIPYNESTLKVLSSLLGSEWFDRLWVWQEIHLANITTATLFCGHDHILWSRFRNAVLCIYTVRRRRNDLGALIQKCFDFCDLADNSAITSILRATRKLKCKEQRDRIYAIQGILHRIVEGYRVLEPDYGTESEEQVYKDFVFSCFSSIPHELEVLRLCNLGQNAANIPTWIPNFFTKDTFEEREFLHGFATADSQAEVREGDGSTLVVKGLSCKSTITNVQAVIPGERLEFYKVALTIRKFWVLLLRHGDAARIKERIGPLCRVLVAGHYADAWEPPDEDLLSFSQYEASLLEVVDSASYTFSEETSEFLSFVWDYLQGRLLYITDDGQFGLAPKGARPGDSIYVLLGTSMPFILRPYDEGKSKHQVVGPCYSSGLMDGEAVMGLLPSHYKIVLKYSDELQVYSKLFLDARTGKTRFEDPRMTAPLSGDWKKNYIDGGWKGYTNTRTGEKYYGRDPRLMSTALIMHGVEIEDIILV